MHGTSHHLPWQYGSGPSSVVSEENFFPLNGIHVQSEIGIESNVASREQQEAFKRLELGLGIGLSRGSGGVSTRDRRTGICPVSNVIISERPQKVGGRLS